MQIFFFFFFFWVNTMKAHLCRICSFVFWITWRKNRKSMSWNEFLICSSSDNLTPPISRVLIGRHLIFCSLTSQMCCNSPRKCTPVKYKAMKKAGFPIVTETPSYGAWVVKKYLINSVHLCSIEKSANT